MRTTHVTQMASDKGKHPVSTSQHPIFPNWQLRWLQPHRLEIQCGKMTGGRTSSGRSKYLGRSSLKSDTWRKAISELPQRMWHFGSKGKSGYNVAGMLSIFLFSGTINTGLPQCLQKKRRIGLSPTQHPTQCGDLQISRSAFANSKHYASYANWRPLLQTNACL